jgi:hypothetical protein
MDRWCARKGFGGEDRERTYRGFYRRALEFYT